MTSSHTLVTTQQFRLFCLVSSWDASFTAEKNTEQTLGDEKAVVWIGICIQ